MSDKEKSKIRTATVSGANRPDLKVGKIDPLKSRIARKTVGGGGFGTSGRGRGREAGMLIDTSQSSSINSSGFKRDAYRTSYAYGLGDRTGLHDIPTYFVTLNEQNGGTLYWPVTLHEKYSWYRYWARCFTSPNVLVTRADGTEDPLHMFKSGDRVINRLGYETEVDKVFSKQYDGDVYKFDVEGNSCSDLEVTPEHPFYILRSDKLVRNCLSKNEQNLDGRETRVEIDYTPEWVEAKDLKVGDFMIVPSTGVNVFTDSVGYNHLGNILIPICDIAKRNYCGLIWNISTKGKTYDERTFLVYGMATHNSDAYIGRSLELLSDLPMSKLSLNMPKMDDQELSSEILAFFEYQLERINAFELCQSILYETNVIGNCFVFHEWDSEKMMWSRAVMLPPEEVYVFQYPFTEHKRVEYRPERLISLIQAGHSGFTDGKGSGLPGGGNDRGEIDDTIVEGIPEELKDMVEKEGCIVMDTDPMTGSFVHHIARRRAPYMDLGASVLERVLVPMLQKEHYRYTQLSLASRNMTPKNLISAPGLLPDELDDLRSQVDVSYLDPEYSVITNYEVHWEQIGVQERFLDFSREYEQIENQVFAAMGVTRELLTGEGQFSGTKITVEILNTMFLLTREVLRNYIERSLFVPVCEAHGWFTVDKNGAKRYLHPEVGFNRLSIRDNAEVFDSLFQLYSKGSLPVEVIYELFNLNTEEMHNKLLDGLFTARDSTFNRMTEEVNSATGASLVEKTNLVEKMAKYLGLDYSSDGPSKTEFVDDSDYSGQGDIESDTESESESDTERLGLSGLSTEDIAAEIVKGLPPNASEDDISESVKVLDEV